MVFLLDQIPDLPIVILNQMDVPTDPNKLQNDIHKFIGMSTTINDWGLDKNWAKWSPGFLHTYFSPDDQHKGVVLTIGDKANDTAASNSAIYLTIYKKMLSDANSKGAFEKLKITSQIASLLNDPTLDISQAQALLSLLPGKQVAQLYHDLSLISTTDAQGNPMPSEWLAVANGPKTDLSRLWATMAALGTPITDAEKQIYSEVLLEGLQGKYSLLVDSPVLPEIQKRIQIWRL